MTDQDSSGARAAGQATATAGPKPATSMDAQGSPNGKEGSTNGVARSSESYVTLSLATLPFTTPQGLRSVVEAADGRTPSRMTRRYSTTSSERAQLTSKTPTDSTTSTTKPKREPGTGPPPPGRRAIQSCAECKRRKVRCGESQRATAEDGRATVEDGRADQQPQTESIPALPAPCEETRLLVSDQNLPSRREYSPTCRTGPIADHLGPAPVSARSMTRSRGGWPTWRTS